MKKKAIAELLKLYARTCDSVDEAEASICGKDVDLTLFYKGAAAAFAYAYLVASGETDGMEPRRMVSRLPVWLVDVDEDEDKDGEVD